MARYRIVFKPSAERAFLPLPKDVQKRLDTRLLALQDNPRPPGVKALTGESGVYRLRVGDYDRVLVLGVSRPALGKIHVRRDQPGSAHA